MSKPVLILSLAVLLVVAGGFYVWYTRAPTRTVVCGDGPHPPIDTRQFQIRYDRYAVELSGKLEGKGSVELKLSPQQMQRVSSVLQQGNAFRAYVVHGYNACAITAAQFAEYGRQFEVLESVAQQLTDLAASPVTPARERALDSLVTRYGELAARTH